MNPYDIDSTEQLRRVMLAQQVLIASQRDHIHALKMKLKLVMDAPDYQGPDRRRAFYAWKGQHEKE